MKSLNVVIFDDGSIWLNAAGLPAAPITAETAVEHVAQWLGLKPRPKIAHGMVRIETAVGVHEFPAIQIAPASASEPAPLDGSAD